MDVSLGVEQAWQVGEAKDSSEVVFRDITNSIDAGPLLNECAEYFIDPENASKSPFILDEVVVDTRVPIIKFIHKDTNINVDVCVGNTNALLNTRLLRDYADFDPRVRPFILAVKLWAKNRSCNSARNSTLSSYAWSLLAVNYLQCLQPPVLPNLQVESAAGGKTTLTERNDMLLGELFLGFFAYHGYDVDGCFSVYHDVSCIREGCVLQKSSNARKDSRNAWALGVLYGGRATKIDEIIDEDEKISVTHTDGPNENNDEKEEESVSVSRQTSAGKSSVISNLSNRSSACSQEESKMWRLCVEDPYEDRDLGVVIRSSEAQRYLCDELRLVCRRAIDIHADLKQQINERVENVEMKEAGSMLVPQAQMNILEILTQLNQSPPQFPYLCRGCGQEGHRYKECPNKRCFICLQTGHMGAQCPRKKCRKCGGRGHLERDCPTKAKKNGDATDESTLSVSIGKMSLNAQEGDGGQMKEKEDGNAKGGGGSGKARRGRRGKK
jgi:hypothetical protein